MGKQVGTNHYGRKSLCRAKATDFCHVTCWRTYWCKKTMNDSLVRGQDISLKLCFLEKFFPFFRQINMADVHVMTAIHWEIKFSTCLNTSLLLDCQRAITIEIRLLNSRIIDRAPSVILLEFYDPFERPENRSSSFLFLATVIVRRLPENFGSFRVVVEISSELFRNDQITDQKWLVEYRDRITKFTVNERFSWAHTRF